MFGRGGEAGWGVGSLTFLVLQLFVLNVNLCMQTLRRTIKIWQIAAVGAFFSSDFGQIHWFENLAKTEVPFSRALL